MKKAVKILVSLAVCLGMPVSISGPAGAASPPSLPTNITAVLNNNPNLPITISPYAGQQQEWWGSTWIEGEWYVITMQDRGFIAANPQPDAVNSSPSVCKLQINYNDNFEDPAFVDGVPRAEIERAGFDFVRDKVYRYTFKTFIPEDYVFDNDDWMMQLMISQTPQAPTYGVPTLQIRDHRYLVERDFPTGVKTYLDDIVDNDLGKWVKWEWEFNMGIPDGSAKLYKNDVMVYSVTGQILPNDSVCCMKAGLYKRYWKDNPTLNQGSIVIYLDDIQFFNITDNITSSMTDFGVNNGISADDIARGVDLSWVNPDDEDHDSTHIYSSLTNNSADAVEIAVVDKTVSTYRHTWGSDETHRYYWIRVSDENENLSAFSQRLSVDLFSGTSAATLTVPNINNGYSLNYGLVGVNDITAQDITIRYDTDLFDFVNAEPVSTGILIVETDSSIEEGTVRLILASGGAGHAISGNADVLNIVFSPKASGSGIIAITDISLADSDGVVFSAEEASITIEVSGNTGLISAIADVQGIYDEAVEGIHAGQYPEGTKNRLHNAIVIAAGVRDDVNATVAQISQAIEDLNAAVADFQGMIITSTTGDINSSGVIDIGDIGKIAGYYGIAAADAGWDAIKHADINDDGQIELYELLFVARRILFN